MKAATSRVEGGEYILIEAAAVETGLTSAAVIVRAKRLGIELPVFSRRRHIRVDDVQAISDIALTKPWVACHRHIA